MNSIKNNLKILPTSSPPTLTSKNNRTTRANKLLYKSYQKFISNSETDLSSEKVNHSHKQWSTHNQSITDFKSLSMTDFNPDISIEDIHNQSQDQTLTCTSNPIVLSEDEDAREVLSNMKTFVDQGSQAILEDSKPKKKTKSSHSKKTKSSSKRPKGLQIPPSTLSIALSNRIISNGDSTSMKVSASIAKNEENNGTKSLITVDISRARSNLEVVRLCLRELGWKEVEI
jgi:hypothetical protein